MGSFWQNLLSFQLHCLLLMCKPWQTSTTHSKQRMHYFFSANSEGTRPKLAVKDQKNYRKIHCSWLKKIPLHLLQTLRHQSSPSTEVKTFKWLSINHKKHLNFHKGGRKSVFGVCGKVLLAEGGGCVRTRILKTCSNWEFPARLYRG